MLSTVKRLLSYIDIVEKDGVITVRGLPANTITADIKRAWSTNRINSNLFIKIDYAELSFYSFFALECYHLLEKILDDSSTKTNRRALKKVLNLLETQTWLKNTTIEHDNIIDITQTKRLAVDLLPSQLNFVRHYGDIVPKYELKGLINASEAGTGKTIGTIALSVCLRQDINIYICPKIAVFDVWCKELKNALRDSGVIWTSVDENDNPTTEPIPDNVNHIICHYDYLEKLLGLIYPRFHNKTFFVAVDESHNFNELSGRTLTLLEIIKTIETQHSLWISGTPIKAMGTEMVPCLTAIDTRFTPEVVKPFTRLFSLDAATGGDILSRRIGLISFKALKKHVVDVEIIEETFNIKTPDAKEYTLRALQEKMRDFINERKEYYDKLKPEIQLYFQYWVEQHGKLLHGARAIEAFELYCQYVSEMSKGFNRTTDREKAIYCNKYENEEIIPSLPQEERKPFKNAATIIKYVALKIQGEALGTVLTRERIACFKSLIKHGNIDQIIDNAEKKTIVFTSYIELINVLASDLKMKKYLPVVLHSQVVDDGDTLLNQFRTNEQMNPLISTFKTLSTAITLVEANQVIYLNTPYREYEMDQSFSRVYRKGQDTVVRLTKLLLDTGDEPNISTRADDILVWSKEQVRILLGDIIPDDGVALPAEDTINYMFKKLNPLQRKWITSVVRKYIAF